MDIQEKISYLMKERDWTTYELAKRAGLSDTTITTMFKRNTAPTINTLSALCAAFVITLSCFFTEDGAPVTLTPEQQRLLIYWSELNEKQQNILLKLIANMNQ